MSEPMKVRDQIYLLPADLSANEANEKARPTESPEYRAKRVAEMAESIKANGQEYPVLIIEVEQEGAVCYEYVDGGCRVDAIAALGEGRTVWCSVLDSNDDLFRRAVVANLHRTSNSVMDMAHIIREVKERHDWKGKGSGVKIAAYLGITPSRVSEYDKILHAPDAIRARIESGEIPSLDAALKVMAVPEKERGAVVDRAAEIARQETPGDTPASVQTRHVVEAQREIGSGAAVDRRRKDKTAPVVLTPRSKSEISEFFKQITEALYKPKVVAFADYIVDWMRGKGTDKKLLDAFDTMVGMKAPSDKPAKAVKKAAAKKTEPKKKAPKGKTIDKMIDKINNSKRLAKAPKTPKVKPVDAETASA